MDSYIQYIKFLGQFFTPELIINQQEFCSSCTAQLAARSTSSAPRLLSAELSTSWLKLVKVIGFLMRFTGHGNYGKLWETMVISKTYGQTLRILQDWVEWTFCRKAFGNHSHVVNQCRKPTIWGWLKSHPFMVDLGIACYWVTFSGPINFACSDSARWSNSCGRLFHPLWRPLETELRNRTCSHHSQ